MKTVLINCLLLSLVGTLSSTRVFFPGHVPTLSNGALTITGYFADSDQTPVLLSDLSSYEPQKPEEVSGVLQSRSEQGAYLDKVETEPRNAVLNRDQEDTNGDPPFFQPFRPFRVTETVTITKVIPPVCVACRCLQGGQSCLAAGGVQLVTLTITSTAVIPAGAFPAGTVFSSPGATVCIASTSAGPIALPSPVIPAGTVITISCIASPPSELSVCDPTCRSNTGAGNNCNAAPSAANCPQITTPNFCSTACKNMAMGDTVRCNSLFPSVISGRPSNACTSVKKRDLSDDLPDIETSIETEFSGRRERFFGLQVAKGTKTRIVTRTGTVTATYVAKGNCLPSNILEAPDC